MLHLKLVQLRFVGYTFNGSAFVFAGEETGPGSRCRSVLANPLSEQERVDARDGLASIFGEVLSCKKVIKMLKNATVITRARLLVFLFAVVKHD